MKARAVAERVNDGIVLAADTVGWFEGHVLAKPADEAEARQILQLLSGNQHELWTGVCIWLRPRNWQVAWQELSRVYMAPWEKAGLEAYLAGGAWRGCSGAYAIQEEGEDRFVHVREGSRSNVIGLPMESLERILAWLIPNGMPGRLGEDPGPQ